MVIVRKEPRDPKVKNLLLLLCCFSAVFQLCSQFSFVVLSSLSRTLSRPAQEEAKNNNNNNKSECIPLHHDFFDEFSWTEAIQKNVYFHDRGGNLKSVQKLKDSSIDSTAEAMGLTFHLESGKNVKTANQEEEEGGEQQQQLIVKKPVTKLLRDHFERNYDPRSGYGRPLPGKWSNEDSKALFEKRWLDVVEPFKRRRRWDAGLGPIGPACKDYMKLGKNNGHKFYCLPLKNQTKMKSAAWRNEQDCHVISVGGNDDWSFEIDVVDKLGCKTHTFDCTLPGGTPKRKPDNPNMRFYNYCADSTTHQDDHGRSYLNYFDMLQTAGIQKPPAYFKIDVEGYEFDFFHQMIQESQNLLPTQIAVELHWATKMTGMPWLLRTRTSGEIALFASMMFHAHYLPLHLDFTPLCHQCMEVLYFRSPPC